MKLLSRVSFALILVMVALVVAACGGESGGGGSSASPADVAKSFLEGSVKGDFNAIRNLVCEAQRGEMTAEREAEARAAMEAMGSDGIDLSGVTYTFNEAASSVTLSGTVKAMGQEVPASIMFGDEGLPMVQEGGSWRVCPPTETEG